jgi:uncharacterized membrane protein
MTVEAIRGKKLGSRVAGRRSPNLAAAIYGTIVASAVVAGLDKANATPIRALGLLLASGAFFWAGHVYAYLVADRVLGHHRMKRDDVSRVMSRELPVFLSSLPLGVPLVSGALGIVGRDTALTLALLVGVAMLAGWGVVFSRREGYGLAGVLGAATVNAAVGLFIVAVKVALP